MEQPNWRPQSLREYIGQTDLVNWLQQEIHVSKAQDRPIRSSLWHGGAGLGKTTLARVLAQERDVRYIELLGPNVTEETLARTFGAYSNVTADEVLSVRGWREPYVRNEAPTEPSILVIDEVEGLHAKLCEMMHHALEPDAMGNRYFYYQHPRAKKTYKYWVPPFTFIGITNYEHMVPKPFKRPGRCAKIYEFVPYTPQEIASGLKLYLRANRLEAANKAIEIIAERSNGSIAAGKEYITEAFGFTTLRGGDRITVDDVQEAFDLICVDELGLNVSHRNYLIRLASSDSGKMSLAGLAAALDADAKTLSQSLEPLLIRKNLIEVVPGGRQITFEGRAHIGAQINPTSGLDFPRAIL